MAASVLQQSWVVRTETIWPVKSKIFTFCPFTKKSLPSPALDWGLHLTVTLLHWIQKDSTPNQIGWNFHWQTHNNTKPENLLIYFLVMELYRNQPTRESQFPYLALKRKSTDCGQGQNLAGWIVSSQRRGFTYRKEAVFHVYSRTIDRMPRLLVMCAPWVLTQSWSLGGTRRSLKSQ